MKEVDIINKIVETPKDTTPGIVRQLDIFLSNIDSINIVTTPIDELVIEHIKNSRSNVSDFFDECCETEDVEDGKLIHIEVTHLSKFRYLQKQLTSSVRSGPIIRRSFIVSLVSEYDAYLSRLLSWIFDRKTDLLKSSEKQFSFSQILDYESIEELKEMIIEKEIENLLRKNHAKQFEWLEKTFDIKLKRNLAAWPIFIELTERRNLFVHTQGKVSSQYLAICKQHRVEFEKTPVIGEELTSSIDYFQKAFECIYEIGVKLTQVLWRKVFPKEQDYADRHLINIIVELIRDENYHLADSLLDFSCNTLKNYSNERSRLVFLINHAQVFKWLDKNEECHSIINQVDWTACTNDFQLCLAVLKDDYETAVNLMKKIGSDGDVNELAYRDWPIFKRFREEPIFAVTFEEVFSTPFFSLDETEIENDNYKEHLSDD